jgi:hypothetical protein
VLAGVLGLVLDGLPASAVVDGATVRRAGALIRIGAISEGSG